MISSWTKKRLAAVVLVAAAVVLYLFDTFDPATLVQKQNIDKASADDVVVPFRRTFETPKNPIHYDAIIIIPYRNREIQRDKFVAHFGNYTSTYFRDKKFLILIAEEDDNKHFSRSWAFNSAFITAINRYGIDQGCIIIHDVDRIPKGFVPYTTCEMPMQLNSANLIYQKYTGGVVSMSVQHWLMVNGFDNFYRGWGKEDDDLLLRIRVNNLQNPKTNVIHRPPKEQGRFGHLDTHTDGHGSRDHSREVTNLEHLREMYKGGYIFKVLEVVDKTKARNIMENNGISSANFVIAKSTSLSSHPNVDAEQISFQLPEEEANLIEDQ